ncbi:MAG: NADH:flavin oxidoreductase [Candidatus Sericytochromatia bacterium]|nr:NADH:flavin oxidoreductase [Candidatus Sericytochromatia bacterium]
MSPDSLFRPFTLKSLTLKNRCVMAPMTRSFGTDGVLPAASVDYYRKRAIGEVGLIVSEGTVVGRPAASAYPGVPHFHGDAALAQWQAVVAAVHGAGGKMAPQLWHMGVVKAHESGWLPPGPLEGPSGLLVSGQPAGGTMTTQDIEATIAAFATAAADAKRLGFDCLELHGAHGYLIDQFLWDKTNERHDRYGGNSLAARTRFGIEIVKAVRQAVGEDFVIIQRLSQWKLSDYDAKLAKTPAELAAWLTPFAEAGVDIFHCSQRRFWEPEFAGSDLNLAGWAKKVTGRPTITVGSVGLSGEFTAAFRGESSVPHALDELIRRHERGDFDLVAVGRALLADPDWVAKIHGGRTDELQGFTRDVLQTLS